MSIAIAVARFGKSPHTSEAVMRAGQLACEPETLPPSDNSANSEPVATIDFHAERLRAFAFAPLSTA